MKTTHSGWKSNRPQACVIFENCSDYNSLISVLISVVVLFSVLWRSNCAGLAYIQPKPQKTVVQFLEIFSLFSGTFSTKSSHPCPVNSHLWHLKSAKWLYSLWISLSCALLYYGTHHLFTISQWLKPSLLYNFWKEFLSVLCRILFYKFLSCFSRRAWFSLQSWFLNRASLCPDILKETNISWFIHLYFYSP